LCQVKIEWDLQVCSTSNLDSLPMVEGNESCKDAPYSCSSFNLVKSNRVLGKPLLSAPIPHRFSPKRRYSSWENFPVSSGKWLKLCWPGGRICEWKTVPSGDHDWHRQWYTTYWSLHVSIWTNDTTPTGSILPRMLEEAKCVSLQQRLPWCYHLRHLFQIHGNRLICPHSYIPWAHTFWFDSEVKSLIRCKEQDRGNVSLHQQLKTFLSTKASIVGIVCVSFLTCCHSTIGSVITRGRNR